jgi:hypothetical protein
MARTGYCLIVAPSDTKYSNAVWKKYIKCWYENINNKMIKINVGT